MAEYTKVDPDRIAPQHATKLAAKNNAVAAGAVTNSMPKNTNKAAVLDAPPTTSGLNLAYPEDVTSPKSQQGHYIQFFILESGQGKLAKESNKKLSAGDTNKKMAAQYSTSEGNVQKNLNSNSASAKTGGVSSRQYQGKIMQMGRNWTKINTTITLYMPPTVKVQYKSEYNDVPISPIAAGGAATIEAFATGVKKGAMSDWTKAGKMAGNVGEAVAEGAAIAGAKLLMGSADIFAPGSSALAQIAAGAVIGNKMELLFQGVGRRDFSYQFTFIPQSASEAQSVAKIVNTFKMNMLPEYMSGKVSAFGKDFDFLKGGSILTIPNAFDISYMYLDKQNPWINKIASCYLTSMDIEYGGDKYVTYHPMVEPISGKVGPPPQRTVVSLNFREIEILTRESAKEQGF